MQVRRQFFYGVKISADPSLIMRYFEIRWFKDPRITNWPSTPLLLHQVIQALRGVLKLKQSWIRIAVSVALPVGCKPCQTLFPKMTRLCPFINRSSSGVGFWSPKWTHHPRSPLLVWAFVGSVMKISVWAVFAHLTKLVIGQNLTLITNSVYGKIWLSELDSHTPILIEEKSQFEYKLLSNKLAFCSTSP